MSALSTEGYAPLPQAPSPETPSSPSVDAAAHTAWQPSVATWISFWRLLIVVEFSVLIATKTISTQALLLLGAATLWLLFSAVAAVKESMPVQRRRPNRAARLRAVLLADLAFCVALIVLAPDEPSRSLIAAYGCSCIIGWAAYRPVDAFIAAAALATSFTTAALWLGNGFSEDIVGTLALCFFFALATSGFFTVAHRIGALEIATEISKERGRYRRDLHDRLGQALSGMHFEVQAVQAVGLDEHAPARMTSLANGYRDALRMLKDLFRVGDEPMLGTNVASVIRQEALRIGQQAGAQVRIETSGDSSRIPPWMRPHIVAVAGESVNNALKNGQAKSIDIAIDVTDDLLVLSVTDDGVGFDNPPGTITEKEGHYGLREMAERARICNGEVVIASQPGFGTRVRLQATIPDGATEDILERDVSKLRENVWTLLSALRIGLGVVAAAQLGFIALSDSAQRAAALIIGALILGDLILGAKLSQTLRKTLQQSSVLGIVYLVFQSASVTLFSWLDLPPSVLLYAPVMLLMIGVATGRRAAMRGAFTMLIVLGVAAAVAHFLDVLSPNELESLLVQITAVGLISLAAVQGAKLLDRLETLQIRVRYQALARLRHGLSGRMREQLTERLVRLENHARRLADSATDPTAFAQETRVLCDESTELKKRLREIVHALADPTPHNSGRNTAHV